MGLVLEKRYIKDQWTLYLELPRGSKDAGETDEQAAFRETQEELQISIENSKTSLLFNVEPDNGILINVIPVFLIDIAHAMEKDHGDDDLIVERLWLNKKELIEKIRSNEIKDGLTLSSLLHLFLFYPHLLS